MRFSKFICLIFLTVPSPQVQAQEHVPDTRALNSALARQRDAETLTTLSAEGQLLYSRERIKLDPYSYCSQAVTFAERGEFRESIRAASKALYLGQQAGNDDLLAVSKRDMAIAYNYAGDLDRAEQYAREALAHKAHQPQIVAGPALKVLGDVAARRANVHEAISFYQKAFQAASEKFRPLVQISLANAYVKAGDLDLARSQFASLGVPANPILRQSYLRGKAEMLLAERKPREALELFRESLEAAKGGDADYQRLWALEGIGRSNLALGERAGAREAYTQAVALMDSVRARFRSEEFKSGLFGDLQTIFEQAILLAMEAGDAVAALELSEKSRARALLDTIRGRVAVSGISAQETRNTVDIRAALRPDEALVEFHSMEGHLYAWVVRAEGVLGMTIPVSRSELTQHVEDFRVALLNYKSNPNQQAANVYKLLIEPLKLRVDERLIIVPHGALHYLPFQALRSGEAYLIEQHALAIAPSASVAVQLINHSNVKRARLTAFGNPEIEQKYDLPGSQREVERLATLFPDRDVFLRRDASKTRFKANAGDSPILHVAAHAEFDAIDPLFSRILLAGTEHETGALEAQEIFDLKLHSVSLVTLSACESGLGKIARGDEIVGFTRSFLSAGASALIVSLWPVSDESTELLMTKLYGEVAKGAGLQQAMQSAQVAVLKQSRFAHPYFWAPFNLVGDWRQKFSDK